MKKIWLNRIGQALIAFLVIAQFFRIDKTNPPADPTKDFLELVSAPENIADMMKASCYDCHSHHSKYPWYTNIAPVSWWIKNHINEGREHLNFSVWGDYTEKRKNHKIEECYEEVEATHMPLLSYLIAHPEARLSEEERAALVSWFKSL